MRRLSMALVAALAVAGPLAAQQSTGGTLPNGLSWTALPGDGTPWVSVRVTVLGGERLDPVDGAGTARLLGRLLFTGTAQRSGDELWAVFDSLGVQPRATTSTDWIAIDAGVARPQAEAAFVELARAVRSPAFSVAGLEAVRRDLLASFGASWSVPSNQATRVLRRRSYGADHPYGRAEYIDALPEIIPTDLRAFHAATFRPERTHVALVGVAPEEAAAWVEAAFGDWVVGGTAAEAEVDAPRPEPGVSLVHQPGATRATVRIGQTVTDPGDETWVALEVANVLLGAGLDHRIGRRLMADSLDGNGFSTLTRRAGPGFFQMGLELPAEQAEQGIALLTDELDRLAREGPDPEELEAVRRAMLGALAVQQESPAARARQLGALWAQGGGSPDLDALARRIRSLGPEDVREALALLDPPSMSVVVVGDGVLLRSRLASLGGLTLEDGEGNVLDLADLDPRPTEVPWDTRALQTGTWEYRIVAGEQPIGSLTRTVVEDTVAGGRTFTMRSEMVTGPQTLIQSATFTDSFEPLMAELDLRSGATRVGARVEVVGDSVRGSRSLPGGATETFSAPLVAGALVGEMLEAALWILPYEVGGGVVLPVVQVQSGAAAQVGIGIAGRTRVTVPAGTFDAYVVEVAGDQGIQVVWVSARNPHVVLRLASPGRSEVLELVRGSTRAGR